MPITNTPNTGIKCDVKSNYEIFGKFMINMNLLCDGILLVKYTRSYAMVPKLKRTKVSKEFKTFLCDLLKNNKIDYTLLKACTQKDKEIFDKLVVLSNVHRQLEYDKSFITKEDETELKLKFQILQGEMIAGNNSEEIIHELKYVIGELVQLKVISLKDSEELIAELP
jgi:hypothetical protein